MLHKTQKVRGDIKRFTVLYYVGAQLYTVVVWKKIALCINSFISYYLVPGTRYQVLNHSYRAFIHIKYMCGHHMHIPGTMFYRTRSASLDMYSQYSDFPGPG